VTDRQELDDQVYIGGYLDRWPSDSLSDTVKATTFQRYEQITRLHLKPTLGRVKLKTMTPAHVRSLPQDSVGDAWTCDYSHDSRHVLARTAEHAGSGCSNGRGPFVVYCCQSPRTQCRGLSAVCGRKRLFAGSIACAGGGTRTHTILRSPDFESGASTNSATPAREPHYYTNAQRSFVVSSVLP
jgi:hypothetical protein